MPSFDCKPKLYFNSILKLENIASVTKWNPKELALVKCQGAVIKFLKSLPSGTGWNSVIAVLLQQFSLVLTLTHMDSYLRHRC